MTDAPKTILLPLGPRKGEEETFRAERAIFDLEKTQARIAKLKGFLDRAELYNKQRAHKLADAEVRAALKGSDT